ncbi:MAG: UPF0175 family protein [Lewinellaceae bacterium]|nr:UPF0175 family protein [Saprospiraceae bacterium]MCB9339159.1 UPF0175 family protein [Lewinellaceae bacterium]
MTIELRDELIRPTGLSELDIKLELSISLFQQNMLTLAQAARLSNIPRVRFEEILAQREIAVHYDVEQLKEDLKTLQIPFR